MRVLFFLLLLLFISCNLKSDTQGIQSPNLTIGQVYEKMGTVKIIPAGRVNPKKIDEVRRAIKNFYGRPVEVLPQVVFSDKLRRTANSRYSADSILKYFRNTDQTIIVTEHDIAIYNEDKKADWGIFGYGHIKGKTCIISVCDCRLGRNVSTKKFYERIRKVTIHEIGHNIGLSHCEADDLCVMHAAEGKGSQVDKEKEEFCMSCEKKLLSGKEK